MVFVNRRADPPAPALRRSECRVVGRAGTGSLADTFTGPVQRASDWLRLSGHDDGRRWFPAVRRPARAPRPGAPRHRSANRDASDALARAQCPMADPRLAPRATADAPD